MEITQFKKSGDKWRPTKLGFAKWNESKKSWTLYFDALPVLGPDTFVVLSQPKTQDRPVNDPARQGPPDDDMPDF